MVLCHFVSSENIFGTRYSASLFSVYFFLTEMYLIALNKHAILSLNHIKRMASTIHQDSKYWMLIMCDMQFCYWPDLNVIYFDIIESICAAVFYQNVHRSFCLTFCLYHNTF